jgi:glycerol-3-phosphate acyltransferase PlsY
MKIPLLIIFSYLMGSIPFGLIAARAKGIDLRKVGSGNIGATNALRAAGKMPAIITLLGDALKGTTAVALGKLFGVGPLYEGVLGLSAVVGHDFSIFLRMKGGKGVSTSIGVLLLYSPVVGVLTAGIWLAAVLLTRYSSLGAIVSFALLPLNFLILDFSGEKLAVAAVMSTLLILKHSDNISKLRAGTERRIGERA